MKGNWLLPKVVGFLNGLLRVSKGKPIATMNVLE
jgi:hypothetical protein